MDLAHQDLCRRVLADMMEDAFDWIPKDKKALLYFKQVTGKTRVCQDLWWDSLPKLLREQHIALDGIVTYLVRLLVSVRSSKRS